LEEKIDLSLESLFCPATAVTFARETEEKHILLFCESAQVLKHWAALRSCTGTEVVVHQTKQVRQCG